ncbi:MAG TPA: TIGR02587 family membrane protein [Pyrinomonadaceae bacterium]|nr:TIGR02587 family membrane protein [Pyrinomonadaceae bacterium]
MTNRNSTEESGGRSAAADSRQKTNRHFGVGLARAFGGAILFSFPMLMTMEMWWLGFYIPPLRFALFMFLVIPLLAVLSYYFGYEDHYGWKDIALDPFVGYAVGFITSGVLLAVFSIIEWGMSFDEIIGKIAIQAVPASIGAMLARNQLGIGKGDEAKRYSKRYGGGLLMMAVGAILLSFSLASTEEMILIGYKMTEWHAVALAILSLLIIYAFIYAVPPEDRGSLRRGTPSWSVFLRFAIPGYGIALLISFCVLWTFGRTDGLAIEAIAMSVIVTAFPASLGVAAARLIL